MYAQMSAILLKATPKHIGVKAVGMIGWCWMTKEISNKVREQEEICHTEACKV